MPVACSTSALTGADGSLYYTPAATKWCLLDNTDFPAGTAITVPSQHDFRVGDPVIFTEEDGGNIDSNLTAGTQYYVVAFTTATISVSATKGGAAITLAGDGGNGAAAGGVVSAIDTTSLPTTSGNYTDDSYTGIATTTNGSGSGLTVNVTVASNNVTVVAVNAGGTRYSVGDQITINGGLLGGTSGTDDLTFTITTASALTGGDTAGHINIKYDPYGAVCQIQSWDLEISRESLDVTTLPCGVGAGSATAGKYAAFRKTQPGFASGTGTITVIFTDNDDALGQRMLDNVLLSSQEGARVRLFVSTVAGSTDVDLANSMYIEADISLESMSLSVNPDDPISAEIGYSVSNVAHLFKTAVA